MSRDVDTGVVRQMSESELNKQLQGNGGAAQTINGKRRPSLRTAQSKQRPGGGRTSTTRRIAGPGPWSAPPKPQVLPDADPEEQYTCAGCASRTTWKQRRPPLPNSASSTRPSRRGRCPVLAWSHPVPSRAVRPRGDDLLRIQFGLSRRCESSTPPCGSPRPCRAGACRPGSHLCRLNLLDLARPLYRAAGGAEPGRQLRWLISGWNSPPRPGGDF